MKLDFFKTRFNNSENKRVPRILLNITLAMLAAYLVAVGMEVYWNNRLSLIITLIGTLSLGLPSVLLVRGYLRAGAIVLVLNVLSTVTINATFGQGIHDNGKLTDAIIVADQRMYANKAVRKSKNE